MMAPFIERKLFIAKQNTRATVEAIERKDDRQKAMRQIANDEHEFLLFFINELLFDSHSPSVDGDGSRLFTLIMS